jgi:hypothetical protein
LYALKIFYQQNFVITLKRPLYLNFCKKNAASCSKYT